MIEIVGADYNKRRPIVITTVAELLQALVEKEKAVLASQPELNHAPMLGDMYEGLAREVLEKALFKGLDLRVVEGKARDSEGQLSGQLDCMIVEGEGDRLPHTNHFLYDLPKIIAIVEVKKTLYGKDLADSFLHLRSVKEIKYTPDKRKIPLVRDAWRTLMRRDLPLGDEIKALSEEEDMIRCVLTLEAHEPLRIVLGYSGFKSELELRRGLIRFIQGQLADPKAARPTPGFGIQSFPSQIICGNACLLKTNGMPFGTPLLKSGFWSFFSSRSNSPLKILLELLWTRLSYTYNISSEIFGEDLTLEAVAPLLEAKWRPEGWEYRFTEMTEAQLNSGPDFKEWEPEFVTWAQFSVLNELRRGGAVSLDDPSLLDFLHAEGTSPDELAAELNKKHLTYRKGTKLFLLADNCECVMVGDQFVAGDNKTGRLERWVTQHVTKGKQANDTQAESSLPKKPEV